MYENLYTAPPLVQNGSPLVSRVGNIWVEDALWLDGIARAPRTFGDYLYGWTDPHQGAEKEVCTFRLLHAPMDYRYLRFIGTLAQEGSGSSTLRLYLGNTLLYTAQRTSGGTTGINQQIDLSGLSLSAWQIVRLKVTLETTGSATARVEVLYLGEESSVHSSYQTPTLFSSGVYSASQFNTIPKALAALNRLARWPCHGFTERRRGLAATGGQEEIARWYVSSFGNRLHYVFLMRKDTWQKTLTARVFYGGTQVVEETYTAFGEKMVTGSVAISPTRNAFNQVFVTQQVTGSGDGSGEVVVCLLYETYQGNLILPSWISSKETVTDAQLNPISQCLRQLANDSGSGYGSGGPPLLFGRNPAWPVRPPGTRERVWLVRTGWPTLRYRVRKGRLEWGDWSSPQSVSLEDAPTSWGGYRTLDLDSLQGLRPGMYYRVVSESREIDLVAETRV